MTDLTKNPDLRSREKVDDYFGDWKWREGLAELMVPIIGRLYRHGVHIMIYGQSLVNASPVEIMKAHRFVRQIEGNELSELETFPLLERLSNLTLSDCEIDIGELTVRCPFFDDLADNPDKIDSYLQEQLDFSSSASRRPSEPQDIVLYGFGRIGRLMARLLVQTTGPGNYFRLKAVVVRKGGENDLVKRASLLRRDSVHGRFIGTIRVDLDNDLLVVNGNPVKFIYASGPAEINYEKLGINKPIVIDNTGIWRDEAALSQHLDCGASKVILTAPAKGNIRNIVFGVNDKSLTDSDNIISAASCTTNAIVPVLKILSDQYGIQNGHIETVHSYTNDQNLIDNFHSGDRRGRSAPLNMVITSTGAVKAVAKAIPELSGKLTGNAIRVPTPNVSLAVLVLNLKEEVTKAELNEFLKNSAFTSKYRQIIGYTNSPEAVSTDFYSSPFATIVDSQATIAEGKQVTLYCWYDNEFGYSKQVLNLTKKVAKIELPRFPKAIDPSV
ncbi:glyceraldehyde-3-phosphate dehydrogenase [Gammaproteobacteria bacterium]|jgi:glyceraldehyde 3-phosphate dehydrogenase|nr:glyceraldehyde-3-phosphate dehydrogenase [Pseudomonadota bacterium]MBT5217222.1 glyceraldehyde-3-phosphate dehydrogenase [Gammaproteobacteria bacterium]MDA9978796.1 glyceraldehyde-3-phosphate dehydrogenase [Gammaproteobacteria bacterium]